MRLIIKLPCYPKNDFDNNVVYSCGVGITVYITISHDDVIKWKNLPRYWPFVWGIHRSPVNSPHKGQWRGVWCFLWSAPEPTMEQTIETPVIWDAIALIMTSLKIALDGFQIAYAKNCFSFNECLSLKTILYHSFKDQGHYMHYHQ